ncbi:MAG: sigma 54-interacting transcriptional regulator [Terriglobales bacterium]
MSSHSGESKHLSIDPQPLASHPNRLDLAGSTDSNRDLVERSRDLWCVHDLQGRLLSVNPVPGRLLSYTTEEVLQTPLRDLIDPKFRDPFDVYLRDVERIGQAHGVMAVLTRTGDRQFWEYHSTLMTGGAETPVVRVIAHDVTDRILAEKALRHVNEKLVQKAHEQESTLRELQLFRSLLDQSNDAIEVIDPETMRFLDVNETESAELGYSREELLSMTVFDIDPLATKEIVARSMEEMRKSGFVILESLHRRKDGTTFPVEINVKRVQLDKEYAVALSRDITERRRRTERLQEYERVVESLAEMIVVVSRDHRYVIANQAFLRPRGMTRKQVVGRHLTEIVHPDSYETTIKEKLDEAFRGHVVDYEMKYEYPGVGERDLAVTYLPVEGATEIDRVAAVMRDITERKQAEEALRTSEREQHKIAEQLEIERARLIEAQAVAKVGSWETELPSLDITWSEQTHRIFETDPSHFHPTRPDFVELVHPEDRAKVDAAFEASLEKSAPSKVEYRIVMADGRVKVLEEQWRVFHDGQGRPARLMGTCQDITERKRMEEELRRAKERLTEEKLYLEQEIDAEFGFHDIIGQSKALKEVMESVGKVASSSATVLLLGETGTGKELVARAIHRRSQRSGNAFIKMNCAAIPSGLLESELFGNEKGAFTGAVSKKIGRLELADKGTLFLDEIGEISLELQPKLLRVLQDHEFERLGGTQTLRSDFRLIAATNRDLAASVQDNEFRSDLYYRLNVFPIHLPPLRERRDDIPLLVEHFVQKCCRKMNKSITSIPTKTMTALTGRDWPGNIRELENFVERSVILTNGLVLAAPLGELRPTATEKSGTEDETLKAKEVEHILQALRESRGQISGPRGAAARLGLKRTTLQSKLKLLGINPRVLPPLS